jgi:predicted alpha/beta-fold hydrolase
LQTVIGSRFPGKTDLPRRISHKLSVDRGSVLMLFELDGSNESQPLVLLAHGMGGCSESGYMRRVAAKLHAAGHGVFLMNHRGSGTGMGMSDSLWNGGSSDDLEKVIMYIAKARPYRSLLLVGFSLSGNILLKYLGEGRKLAPNIAGAFAVNPPIDLKVASRLLSADKRSAIFNWYYMSRINRQVAAMSEVFPHAFRPARQARTIWEFDAVYTAPAAGYKSEEEYYGKCSAKQFLENIRVSTTILYSHDDPFIPPELFENCRMSLAVNYIATRHGGHMGYISREPTRFGDYRWMDQTIVDWATRMPL